MPALSAPRCFPPPKPASRSALRIIHGCSQASFSKSTGAQAESRSVPTLGTGTVLQRHSVEPELWRVELQPSASSFGQAPKPGATISARQATGCLLEPSPGDLVLLMLHSKETHYVLHVLERKHSAHTIHLPGDLTVDAGHGKLTLQGQEVSMHAGDAASVFGKEVTFAGQTGRMRFAGLDLLAKSLDARIQNIRTMGGKVRLAAASLTSRVGRALRLTGFELHRAKSVRTEVDERFSIQAGQADILAKDSVTVDAEKIHLG